uniref:BON domain-containing protein n=1 Tax=Eiseniibacteriota bacterium TaxID=2212470 RepID=A0A832MNM5_UNCEI
MTLAVEGLAGADAAARAKEALAALPGVTAVEVRPAQDRAYVVCGHDVADSALTGAVGRAGPGLAATVVAR